jgi:hypothetical protein
MTDLEFIQKGRKYLLHPVMNWDQQGDKEKNKQTLEQNKQMFITDYSMSTARLTGYLERPSIHYMILMGR